MSPSLLRGKKVGLSFHRFGRLIKQEWLKNLGR